MSRVIRIDRGIALDPPKWTGNGKVFEGVAGRVHPHGDGLFYGETPSRRDHYEYRSPEETRSIATQLARGVPFTNPHPPDFPTSAYPSSIVGKVIGGRFDDGRHAVATIHVNDPRTIDLIRSGQRELSLGYACHVDDDGWQTEIEVEHLALVPAGRCGTACAIRADSSTTKRKPIMCECKECQSNTDQDPESAARARMKARRDGTRFANVSSTGSTFVDEVRAQTGAFDVPADAIAAMAMAARTANALVMDPAEREARVRAHVINGIKKLQESAK